MLFRRPCPSSLLLPIRPRLLAPFLNMPPRGSKRKAAASNIANGTSKRFRSSASRSPERYLSRPLPSTDPLRLPHPFHEQSEENGIVLRKFYPHEMSNARARAYNANELPRPMEELNAALADTAQERRRVMVKETVVHLFKMDLRTKDNRGLFAASETAKAAGASLIGLYIISPQDFEAHLRSPVRVDFTLRSLEVLKGDLAKLDIPLYVETVHKRKDVPGRILALMEEWGARHLFANIEYEVDELRREAKRRWFQGLSLRLEYNDDC